MIIVFVVCCLGSVLATPNNASSNVDLVCEPDFIRCICGSSSDRLPYLTTSIKSCFDNVSSTCQTCKSIEMSSVCQPYAQCQTCGEGLDRCLTCPPGIYGQWCNKDCHCVNDGACDLKGECICQPGFTGKNCEILVVFEDSINKKPANGQGSGSKRRTARQAETETAKCRPISSPYNGVVQIDADPKPGSVAKYICNENYTIIGSRSRTCQPSGLWSGETPTCERLCAFPNTTSNLNVAINPNRVGPPLYDSFGSEILSELEFNCSSGLTLIGARVVRCAGGNWDHATPTCQTLLLCEDPGDIWHGSRKLTGPTHDNMFPAGAQITYHCDSNYIPIGEATCTCTPRGTWSSPPPTCIPSISGRCTYTCLSPDGAAAEFKQLLVPITCSAHNYKDDVFVLTPDITAD